MLAKKFKIPAYRLKKKTGTEYVIDLGNKDLIRIPSSQVISFEEFIEHNPYIRKDEKWIRFSLTMWIWNKADIEYRLSGLKKASVVIIENETHFGIKWDYVIPKRKDIHHCFFCHCGLTRTLRTRDHLVPSSVLRAYGFKGGIPNNVVPCCKECNQEKGSLSLEVFIDYVRRQIHETGAPRYRIMLFTLQNLKV